MRRWRRDPGVEAVVRRHRRMVGKGHDLPAGPGGVDLEARLRDLADAVAAGDAEAFLAARFQAEVDEVRYARAEALAWFGAAPRTRPVLGKVTVKRNLTFCDGEWPGVGAGVAVLSWDQDGLVTSVTVQLR